MLIHVHLSLCYLSLYLDFGLQSIIVFKFVYVFSSASVPRAKDGAFLQMKLLYNPFVHVLRFLLQWMDLSCSCLLPTYLNLFYVVVYKVGSNSPICETQQKLSFFPSSRQIKERIGTIGG